MAAGRLDAVGPDDECAACQASCRTSSWCSTNRASTPRMMPNVKVPPDTRIASARPTASCGRSWSRAPAARAGTPSTTCSPGCPCAPTAGFADSVTRIAAGRVKRGLPYALRHCGYKTYSLYSWFGAFVGARRFQTTDRDRALSSMPRSCAPGRPIPTRSTTTRPPEVIAPRAPQGPVFVFVYLATNHFPWNYRYRPDLLPDWEEPGNGLRDRRISAPPGTERGGFRALQAASRPRVSR